MQSQKRNIAEGTAHPWVEIFHQSNILANRMPDFPASALVLVADMMTKITTMTRETAI